MTYAEKYLEEFKISNKDELLPWQEDLVKRTLAYKSACLKDSLINLFKTILAV